MPSVVPQPAHESPARLSVVGRDIVMSAEIRTPCVGEQVPWKCPESAVKVCLADSGSAMSKACCKAVDLCARRRWAHLFLNWPCCSKGAMA